MVGRLTIVNQSGLSKVDEVGTIPQGQTRRLNVGKEATARPQENGIPHVTLLPKNILILAAALLLGARPASAQQVQVLEHDTSAGFENSVVQVDADTYALAYQGADSDGFLKTFTIAGDCPTDLVLANQTLSGTQIFRSESTMTVGPNRTVPSGAALTLRSRTIRLEAGVSVQLGATLHADTSPDPCDITQGLLLKSSRVFAPAEGSRQLELSHSPRSRTPHLA